jgi:multiple sugar transport system ATP-binding protein
MARVLLQDVTKVYDGQGRGEGVTAVERMNLEIHDKEFLVLVGPSGCGKSTVLRMIAGLETISGGELYIGDRLCNDVPPKDRDIAMVFQNYALYPQMTVMENMSFGLRLRRFPKHEITKRVEEAAEILGLTPYLSRKPKALSGGQRQRVALGRAIVRQPAVFLFDEPLSNLDAKMRVQMRVEISGLAQQLQTTMIYVTHDQTEAMTMGDRIVCMRDGVVEQVGTPLDLYDRPASRFVAGFIGTPPMNFIPCRVEEDVLQIAGCTDAVKASDWNVATHNGGGAMTLGIRPEALRITADDETGIRCRVDVIEPLGPETLVYCSVDDHRLVARLDSRTHVNRGETITLRPEGHGVHLFDQSESRQQRSDYA